MVERQLNEFFTGEGYTGIPSNLPEFSIYFHMENNYVNVFHVIQYRQNLYISKDQYLHIKDKIRDLFLEKGIRNIHILSLIICNDGNKAKQLCADDAMCWMIDSCENRLMIYENQVSDFYGMKEKLEYFLAHLQSADEQEEIRENISQSESVQQCNRVPVVTSLIVALNILIFLLCTFTGDLLYNKGAISAGLFWEGQEYYRALTSMFLHWDINHLTNNMIVLYYLGKTVENYFGKVWYGTLYLAAGICGSLLSVAYKLHLESSVVRSAGASGAVFGVIGALFVLVVAHKGSFNQISFGRIALVIVYSLYSGFVGVDIDNAAHIGGFLGGMAIALAWWLCRGLKMRKTVQNVQSNNGREEHDYKYED